MSRLAELTLSSAVAHRTSASDPGSNTAQKQRYLQAAVVAIAETLDARPVLLRRDGNLSCLALAAGAHADPRIHHAFADLADADFAKARARCLQRIEPAQQRRVGRAR